MVSDRRSHDDAPGLSVIMPALNEAEGIAQALDAAQSELSQVVARGVLARFEIVLVDDGSSDATAEVAEAAATRHPNVTVVRHARNRGIGAAFRTGLDHIGLDLVLWTDADMPVDLLEVVRALPLLQESGAIMVAGRRSSSGGEGRIRQLATQVYDRLMATVAGPIPPDVNFPFKLARSEDVIVLPLRTDGALLDVELCRLVQRDGGRIASLEMPYRGRETGKSKTMSVRLLATLALELARNRQRLRASSAPLP